MAQRVVTNFFPAVLIPPGTIQRIQAYGLAYGAVAGAVAFALAEAVLWRDLPVMGPKPDGSYLYHHLSMAKVAVNALTAGGAFQASVAEYKELIVGWMEEGSAGPYWARVFLSGLAGVGAAFGGWLVGMGGQTNYIYVTGRLLREGKQAVREAQQESKAEIARSGGSVFIHPELQLSNDRCTKHIMIGGSVGGGKTTIILPLIDRIIKANERAIIFDIKGDFTAKFKSPVLFAPWDKRSWAWDIGKDCITRQDARELATRLIEDSKDPMWANASRQVLVGMIVKLQIETGTDWGFSELRALLSVPENELLDMMESYNPEAIRAVEQAGQTTTSILINLSAFLSIIFDLADAWGDVPKERRMSFVEWLSNDKTKRRQIILQGNGRYAALTRGYVSSIIATLTSRINSPEFPDSRTRKLWFILEELPQFGKLDVASLLEVGRSKDVRVVMGFQDINQLKKIYSSEEAAAWMSMVGTHIFARVSSGETADTISSLIGKQVFERKSTTVSSQPGQGTTNLSREEISVMTPTEMQTELGPVDGGVKSVILGFKNAHILKWPYPNFPNVRKSYVAAAWVGGPEARCELSHDEIMSRMACMSGEDAEREAIKGIAAAASDGNGGPGNTMSIPIPLISSRDDFEQSDDGIAASQERRRKERREVEERDSDEERKSASKPVARQDEDGGGVEDAVGPAGHMVEHAAGLQTGTIGAAAIALEALDAPRKRLPPRERISKPGNRTVPDSADPFLQDRGMTMDPTGGNK